MSDEERYALNWIEILVEAALRARAGHRTSESVRCALASNPTELHDLDVIEALLA